MFALLSFLFRERSQVLFKPPICYGDQPLVKPSLVRTTLVAAHQ